LRDGIDLDHRNMGGNSWVNDAGVGACIEDKIEGSFLSGHYGNYNKGVVSQPKMDLRLGSSGLANSRECEIEYRDSE
jgi:hypothetical protein